MTRRLGTVLFALALGLAPAAVGAVQPDEILPDPALEARARALSSQLRCVVCRNESIDESNAELARDMRLALRERLLAGDSDAEAIAFLVERYGEYILLRPRAEGVNLLLWVSPVVLAMLGIVGAGALFHRRRSGLAPPPLSAEEKARLDALLRE